MAKVNSTPYNQIPEDWAFDAQKGAFLRNVLDQLSQIRNRTGGGEDFIVESQEEFREIKTNADILGLKAQVKALNSQISTLNRINNQFEKQLKALKAEILTNA